MPVIFWPTSRSKSTKQKQAIHCRILAMAPSLMRNSGTRNGVADISALLDMDAAGADCVRTRFPDDDRDGDCDGDRDGVRDRDRGGDRDGDRRVVSRMAAPFNTSGSPGEGMGRLTRANAARAPPARLATRQDRQRLPPTIQPQSKTPRSRRAGFSDFFRIFLPRQDKFI